MSRWVSSTCCGERPEDTVAMVGEYWLTRGQPGWGTFRPASLTSCCTLGGAVCLSCLGDHSMASEQKKHAAKRVKKSAGAVLVSVGLNPAYQKTLTFDSLAKGSVNRATSAAVTVGGGCNSSACEVVRAVLRTLLVCR